MRTRPFFRSSLRLAAGFLLFLAAGAVSLRGVSPVFTSLDGNTTAAVSHPENILSVFTLISTDDDNQPLTYSVSGGTDSALFEINATTNALQFIAYPDYEYPHDSDEDNAYDVTVVVSDGNLTDAQDVTVTVTDVNDTYWTFTNAAATGRTGPTQSQINAAYVGTSLEGNVTINTQGIQEWVVPYAAIYRIEVRGAKGGEGTELNVSGGKGARIIGAFALDPSSTLNLVVGQQGLALAGGGGGGASFVWDTFNPTNPLIASGGGGGSGEVSGLDASGDVSVPGSGYGGSATDSDGLPGAGGGWLSAGGGGGKGGKGIRDEGATGGDNGSVDGGFGGGGAEVQSSSSDSEGGGGGGGYSGGSSTGNQDLGGSGGTSYNEGIRQYNEGGYQTSHGLVVITFIKTTNQAPTDVALSNASVAENSSFGTIVGTFTTTDPDDTPGTGTYEYSFVDGNGSTDNASFMMEVNGTLKNAASFDYETKNSYSIRVRVADESNASYEETFSISVIDLDDTAPVITLLGDINMTHEAGIAYVDLGATWMDAVDGNGTASVSGTVLVSVPGTYVLTYSHTDIAGNSGSQLVRSVTVVDTTSPIINLTGDTTVNHEAGTVYADADAIWTDAVDGNGSIEANGTVNVNIIGTYVLTYDVTDAASNAASQVSRTVTVVDTTRPVIILTGDATVSHEAGTAYVDAGSSWFDALDGNGTLEGNGTVNINVPGTYVLTYSITDMAGNVAFQASRAVTVVDTTRPVITLMGDATVNHEAGTVYADAGATWTDAVDGNGTLGAATMVNVSVLGTYTLSYSKTDGTGNVASQVSRTVMVVDSTPPLITLNGDADVAIEAGTVYVDAGASWTDLLDGNGSVEANGSVNTMVPGIYTLSYDHSDSSGNVAQTVSRTVVVFNRDPAGISLSGFEVEELLQAGTTVGLLSVPADADSNVSKNYTFSLYEGEGSEGNAYFQIDANGTLRTGSSLDFESIPSFSIRGRVVDQFGGSAEESFIITVVDAFVPIVDTEAYKVASSGAQELQGTIVDVGHSKGVLEVGFVMGTNPDPQLGQGGVTKATAIPQGEAFSVVPSGLEAGKNYYFRAYAQNAEGSSYGAQEQFTATSGAGGGPSWTEAVAAPEAFNWWTSPWFGSFFLADNGWMYHESFGWLFPAEDGAGGVWLWQETLGWFWTDWGIFPYFNSSADDAWHFLLGEVSGQVLVYRFSDGAWINLTEGTP